MHGYNDSCQPSNNISFFLKKSIKEYTSAVIIDDAPIIDNIYSAHQSGLHAQLYDMNYLIFI